MVRCEYERDNAMTNIQKHKAAILASLYNKAMCPGNMALIAYHPDHIMTTAEAQTLLDATPSLYFDYIRGRVLKVRLSGDFLEDLDFRLYDRDNGPCAGYMAALDALTKP